MASADPADNGHGDPFPDRPPQYVRALLYEYRFRPGNIRADRAVVGAPVGGALFPAGQPPTSLKSRRPKLGRFPGSAEIVNSDSPAAVAAPLRRGSKGHAQPAPVVGMQVRGTPWPSCRHPWRPPGLA